MIIKLSLEDKKECEQIASKRHLYVNLNNKHAYRALLASEANAETSELYTLYDVIGNFALAKFTGLQYTPWKNESGASLRAYNLTNQSSVLPCMRAKVRLQNQDRELLIVREYDLDHIKYVHTLYNEEKETVFLLGYRLGSWVKQNGKLEALKSGAVKSWSTSNLLSIEDLKCQNQQ